MTGGPIEINRGVVHPWMCDEMGHLATRHYLPFFDDGARHFFAALGYSPQHLKDGTGFADVTTTQTYRAELTVGDLVVVHGEATRLGKSSIGTRYVLTRISDGTVAAEQTAVTVQFDLDKRAARPVLDEIREAIHARFPGLD